MELKWGHLCEDVDINSPAITVRKIHNIIPATKDTDISLPEPTYLAMLVHADRDEVRPDTRIQLQLEDAIGIPRSDPLDLRPIWNDIGPGHPLMAPIRLRLDRPWVIPQPGAYQFALRSDGDTLGRVAFFVLPRSGALPPSFSVGLHRGPQLEWAHIVDSIDFPPDDPRLTLSSIVDFFTMPRSLDVILLNAKLAALMSIDPDDASEQKLKVTLVNGAGSEVVPPATTMLRSTSFAPGQRQYLSYATTLNDLPLPRDNNYTFHFYLNDRYVGSTDLRLISA